MTTTRTISARTVTSAAALGLLLGAAACAGDTTTARPSGPASSASGAALPQGADPVDLDPEAFTAGSEHPYFPLEPGRRWTYREVEDGTVLEVVVTVTTRTRQVANGVEARVVRDSVTEDGALVEDTLDWYAQDAEGNVWYLGEDTAELEDGEISTRAGSFEAGVDGALPGVIMPAAPEPGTSYRQEYYAGEAEDNGTVLAVGQQVDTPSGHYDEVVLTADTITTEPGVLEYKLYAPGVGMVSALGISGGGGREELVSTEVVDGATARRAATAPLGTPYG